MAQTQTQKNTLEIPVKLYRIGELVNCTPFSRQTIHNYTTMGLIREAQWSKGGHRLYGESVFRRLSRIIDLKKTKTLAQIRQILNKEQVAEIESPPGQKTVPEKGTDRDTRSIIENN